jgi:hypothetical protein
LSVSKPSWSAREWSIIGITSSSRGVLALMVEA